MLFVGSNAVSRFVQSTNESSPITKVPLVRLVPSSADWIPEYANAANPISWTFLAVIEDNAEQ